MILKLLLVTYINACLRVSMPVYGLQAVRRGQQQNEQRGYPEKHREHHDCGKHELLRFLSPLIAPLEWRSLSSGFVGAFPNS